MSSPERIDLGATESLCPVCLDRIPARRVQGGEDVYLEKGCRRHGAFRTILWRGPPSYQWWGRGRPPAGPAEPASTGGGCPFECGDCSGHLRPTCCALLEVTSRCDLRCPVCFAAAGPGGRDPDLAQVAAWYRRLLASSGGPVNVQLSGGEPTLRDDLPEIIALGRSLGFTFFQLNTNGLRLARDGAYLKALKEAGLGCVFLQFDGLSERAHRRLRGAALLSRKLAAIDRCADLGVGVVLVATLVPGVNTDELGGIVSYAARRGPAVRGVHFQPVSYFGRHPGQPSDAGRFTLPEVMRALEEQTGGTIRVADLHPPSAESPFCSFSGSFLRAPEGTLRRREGDGGGGSRACCADPSRAGEVSRAREYVARRWAHPAPPGPGDGGCCSGSVDALDRIVADAAGAFCVSGMAFQDAWNVDLARLRECFLRVVSPDGRVVPFCAYNLTSAAGRALYRRGAA